MGHVLFAMVPKDFAIDPKVPPSTKAVYLALSAHARAKTGKCWPSQKLLAAETGLSVPTVKRAVAQLRELGIIQSSQIHHQRTIYNLTPPHSDPEQGSPMTPAGITHDPQNKTKEQDSTTTVSRPTSSSANVAPSPQAATTPDDKPAEAQTVPSPLQEIGDENIKNQLVDIAVRASGDWQHYLNEDIPADRFEPPESIDVLEQSLNNLYDVTYRIVGDDICNKGWDDRLAKLIAQKPDRPRWGAAVWVNTYINWVRLQR